MIRACLCLLAGVYALQLSSFAVDSDLNAVAFVAFVVAFLLRHWRDLACFLAGVAVFAMAAADVVDSRLAPEFAGDSMVMRVRVIDFPVRNGPTTTFLGEALDDHRAPGRLRISWFEAPVSLRLGDIWQFELRLRRPRGSSNPGVFDYETWLFRTGIGATGYVVAGRRNHLVQSGRLGTVHRFRQQFVDRLQALLPEPRDAAVLAAISVGARHLISRDQWDRYARTGTSHLMAISGLHIGLAAGGGYVLASVCCGLTLRRGNHHVRATAFALLIAVVYALVSGLGVPAQRASLMIGVAAVAVLRRRQPHPMRIIAFACLLLLVISPVATMAPGFKLSFAAVLILLWLARRRQRMSGGYWLSKGPTAIRQLATMQVLLLLGLLPLVVLIFGRVALIAPAVNLLAVPVFSFITVPLMLGGMLLDGFLQFPGDQALHAAAASLGVIENLIEGAAEIPAASQVVPGLTGFSFAYLLLPLVWVLLPPAWPGRYLAWLGLAALLLYQPPRPAPGCADVDVLDVGQGLAIVIRSKRHVLLYDTGPAFRGGGSIAATVVLPYLASLGIERIDTFIVSHADLDHAGGVAAVRAGIDVGRVIAGETLPQFESRSHRCRAGERWQQDGIEFEFLHPVRDSPANGNDASCVLMIRAGEHRLLLTGDIERRAEDDLVRRGVLPSVAAVVVPHHGSGTSSGMAFVRALQPGLAIVSAGHGNRWGLPKQEIVSRWEAAGARVLDTAASGAISMRFCADTGIGQVLQNRVVQRRIWHE